MSRNETFLFLACALAAAMLANSSPSAHSSRVTLASLLQPSTAGSMADPALIEHGFDRQ